MAEELRFKTQVLKVVGENEALFGLGLSHGLTSDMSLTDFIQTPALVSRLKKIAKTLVSKDGGHNKFMESIVVYLDIKAPRYWWQEFDTYRTGMTKQSEATMHSIFKKPVVQTNFVENVPQVMIDLVNEVVQDTTLSKVGKIVKIKRRLPESFLQRRIISTNLKTLRNILQQRENHTLPEWHLFAGTVLADGLIATYLG